MRVLVSAIACVALLMLIPSAIAKNGTPMYFSDPGGGSGNCDWPGDCHKVWYEFRNGHTYQCDGGWYQGDFYFWGCFQIS